MAPKVGLQTIRALSVFTNTILLLNATILMVRGGLMYDFWQDAHAEVRNPLVQSAQGALGFGVATSCICLFGYLAICINGYGMLLVYYGGIWILIIGMSVFGVHIWMEAREGDIASSLLWLKASINKITLADLDWIQKKYHCCGVEKYTDYLLVSQYQLSRVVNLTRIKEMHPPAEWGWKRPTKLVTIEVLPTAYTTQKVELNRRFIDYPNTDIETTVSSVVQSSTFDANQKNLAALRIAGEFRKKSWRKIATTVGPTTLEQPKGNPTLIWRPEFPNPIYARNRSVFRRTQIVSTLNQNYSTKYKPYVRSYFWHPIWDRNRMFWEELEYNSMDIIDGFFTSYGVSGIFPKYAKIIAKRIIKGVIRLLKYMIWLIGSRMFSVYRWFFSSGWDRVFYISAGGKIPRSCCKNPTVDCQGSLQDTYLSGCREKLTMIFKTFNIEISITCLCFAAVQMVNIAVTYILIGGIREKYYF